MFEAAGNATRVFVSFFLIANALPIIPIFVGHTEDLERRARRSLTLGAVFTGTLVAISVAVGGPALFGLMGVGVNELRVAGGIILFVFATHDILFSRIRRKERAVGPEELGVVPLGIPILVGPATLAMAIALGHDNGRGWVVIAVLATGLLNLLMLLSAFKLSEVLGTSAIRAISSVMSLFLAAIAVSMVHIGIDGLLV